LFVGVLSIGIAILLLTPNKISKKLKYDFIWHSGDLMGYYAFVVLDLLCVFVFVFLLFWP